MVYVIFSSVSFHLLKVLHLSKVTLERNVSSVSPLALLHRSVSQGSGIF